jgi:molybdenum cofactor biosynthesis protein B
METDGTDRSRAAPDGGHEGDHDHGDHGHEHDHADHDHGDPGNEHDHGAQDHDHDRGEHGHDHDDHHAVDVEDLSFAVLSITSSRHATEDESGDLAIRAIEDAGYEVADYHLVDDDVEAIRHRTTSTSADVVLATGGTGLTPDDVTVEALGPLFEKEIPGFGERFRQLSHEDIGEGAMLSRAVAGTLDGTVVFALPGSPSAVELGLEAAILPIVTHAVGLVRR